jgi:hypothetical protein
VIIVLWDHGYKTDVSESILGYLIRSSSYHARCPRNLTVSIVVGFLEEIKKYIHFTLLGSSLSDFSSVAFNFTCASSASVFLTRVLMLC